MTEGTIPNHPHIELLERSSLKPNPKNPRTHSQKQLQQIGASINQFGFIVPIIIDDDNNIVAGHGRWAASKALGHVPVIRVKFISEADRRAFALAENRIAEQAGWDKDLLSCELEYLLEHDYNIEITGFNLSDIDFSIGGEQEKEKPEEVELPDPDEVAVSQLGDLWHIGPHRLYCGSSHVSNSYEVLLGEDRASMIFADPPYNVPITGHVSGLGKHKHREFAHASGEMNQSEFTQFLRGVFKQCVMFSSSGSIHFQCMDWRHVREILDAADGVYAQFKQMLVWVKDNAGMGSFYRSQHELIFAFKSGKAKHINNFGLGETGRYRTNVVNYAGANTFRKGRDADLASHPTVKPTALVADLILDCSKSGDIILDPFCGSGTTLLAAQRTKRIGAAIEIDPLYVDTALKRLSDAMGIEVMHADGRDFKQVKQQRLHQAAEAADGQA